MSTVAVLKPIHVPSALSPTSKTSPTPSPSSKTPSTPMDFKTRNIRPVFISFYYFSSSWKSIPFDVLTDSILLFGNVKKSWIFPQTSKDVFESDTLCPWLKTLLPRMTNSLLLVLQRKEQQNLLFWKPEIDLQTPNGKTEKKRHTPFSTTPQLSIFCVLFLSPPLFFFPSIRSILCASHYVGGKEATLWELGRKEAILPKGRRKEKRSSKEATLVDIV